MAESHDLPLLRLPRAAQAALVAGARDNEPVRGLTHNFYKYPARFSPIFARAAIEAFTQPGDLVLDNHVGGGTTLVEALATGRHAIGVDISALAEFVASVKTMVFTEAELDRLQAWARCLPSAIQVRKSSIYFADEAELGYYKHLGHPSRWRLRKAIEQGLGAAIRLATPRLESFGRCVVLRTAQWALDSRSSCLRSPNSGTCCRRPAPRWWRAPASCAPPSTLTVTSRRSASSTARALASKTTNACCTARCRGWS